MITSAENLILEMIPIRYKMEIKKFNNHALEAFLKETDAFKESLTPSYRIEVDGTESNKYYAELIARYFEIHNYITYINPKDLRIDNPEYTVTIKLAVYKV